MRLFPMKIGTKILLPVFALLFIMVISFSYLISNVLNNKNEIIRNIKSANDLLVYSDRLINLENRNDANVLLYRLYKDAATLESIRQTDAERESTTALMLSSPINGRSKELLQDYTDYVSSAGNFRQELLAAVQSGDDARIEREYNKWKTKDELINASLTDIVVYSTTVMNQNSDLLDVLLKNMIGVYVGVLISIVVLIVLLYVYLDKVIVEPLLELTEGARKIAEQGLIWESTVRSNDEVGMLGAALGNMSTQLREYYGKLQKLAFNDPLTELPNRQALEEQFEDVLMLARSRGKVVGVLLLDLDRFKIVNDTLGHNAGDLLLKETASRLISSTRKDDVVARLGGDEFIILISDVNKPDDLLVVAEKILHSIEQPFEIQGQRFYLSTSIGMAVYPQDAVDIPGLLKKADIALYEVKRKGRNGYKLYSQIGNIFSASRPQLEKDLKDAVRLNQLKVFYQPIYDPRKNEVPAVEMLLRWQHPSVGLVPPEHFIPLAEESGLILPIGRWVIEQACKQSKAWAKKGIQVPRFAVNVSARQFINPRFVEDMSETLQKYECAPRMLELELTESIAMENISLATEKLKELQKLGVSLTVDDFGTGHSTLRYLKILPVKKLKIDKSFVRDCLVDEHDAAIIRAIISMSHSLNLKVIAEGVEQEMQMDFLKSMGCDKFQGNLIAAPMSAEEFGKWMVAFKAVGWVPASAREQASLQEVDEERKSEDEQALPESPTYDSAA